MKPILALTMLLSLLSAASAATENYTSGPYEFSFDMNTTLNHSVQIQEILETSTTIVYPLLIKTSDNESASIVLVEYKNLSDSTLDTMELIAARDFEILGYNNNSSLKMAQNLTIDDKKGFALMGNNSRGKQLMQASYWLDSKDCECGPVSVGRTKVTLTSYYPEDIFYWFISTLNVEKSKNATANKMPTTFKPPS